MKEWIIKEEKQSYTIVTEQSTLLKGSVDDWSKEIEVLENYFSGNKFEIYESENLMVKQDYHLNVLSYSYLKESKKSALSKNKIHELFLSYLELSPFYKQLSESWEDLQEEVQFLNTENKYPIKFNLKDFSKAIIKKQLIIENDFSSDLNEVIEEIELIKLLNNDKRQIFLMLSPENKLTRNELIKFEDYLFKQMDQFIIISEHPFNAAINIKHRKEIINELVVKRQAKRIKQLLPFVWSEEVFRNSTNLYLNVVDNSSSKTVVLSLSSVDNLEKFIYVFLLLYVTKIPFRVDTSGISDQYKTFIESVITSEV